MMDTTLNFAAADIINDNIIKGFIDKDLVDKETQKTIDNLIEKHGKKLFSLIIYKLTNLEIQPAKAKEVWDGIMSHRYHLNKMLRRDVGIYVAAIDYLINISNSLIKKPTIIEENYLQSIKKNVMIDSVTGLYNTSYYNKRIKEEFSEAARHNTPLSLLMINIDDFRKIDEYLGLDEAHIILKEVANVLKNTVRMTDIIIHAEAGEFIIILPRASKKDTLIVGEKIRKRIEDLNLKKKITISGGVATYPMDTSKDTITLLDIAKSALYQAKYEGKNRICSYTQERRKFKRIPITEELKISLNVISPAVLQQKIKNLKNISKSGVAFFVEDIPLNPADFVEGFIKKDSNTIKFVGQVIWVSKVGDHLSEVGIRFL